MSSTYLFGGYGLLRCLVQLFNGARVMTQIFLASDEDDGMAGAEMKNLRDPLYFVRIELYDGNQTKREKIISPSLEHYLANPASRLKNR